MNQNNDGREFLLARVRKLSDRITRRTVAAGITSRELEKEAFKAYRYIKITLPWKEKEQNL